MASQNAFIELHKNTNKEFYVLLSGKGRVTHESSQYYSNREDALDPNFALAERFGGKWDGMYKDCTGKTEVLKIHIHPKGRAKRIAEQKGGEGK